MIPNSRFLKQDKAFWAHVRSISQHIGYTHKKTVKVPTIVEICTAFEELNLNHDHLYNADKPTTYGQLILEYFAHRADLINNTVQHNLMDATEAKSLFKDVLKGGAPRSGIPMNKQKGKKRAPAYLTAMVNMMVERNCGDVPCDFDPRELTTVTKDRLPLRTLARRVDGAFPSVINPVAIWEVKEYYYTTTFGSRVADGVYESLLDGLELEDLREEENIDIRHYPFIDAKFTWWVKGRSYLCRIIDMLHMGYVDEVIVGREVITRLPELVPTWVELAKKSKQTKELKKTGVL